MVMMWDLSELEVDVPTPRCFYCKREGVVRVPAEGVRRWLAGEPVQVAFPELDADQRELLISGTHAPCWNAMMGEEE